MYQIFSRKTFLFTTVWLGVCFSWLQTQALACCWPWCCCYHQPDARTTVSHKEPLINHIQQSDQQRGYGTTESQTPQQDPMPDSRPSTTTGRHDDILATVTILPSSQQAQKQQAQKKEEEPVLESSASLVSVPLDSPYHEWQAETFQSTSCKKIWKIQDTIFGDEELPVAHDELVKGVLSIIPKNAWAILRDQSGYQKLLYKKVLHYTLPDSKEAVENFIAPIGGLWAEDPNTISFAYFEYKVPKMSTKVWLFFAKKGNRLLYIKTPCLDGINDQNTLGSQSVTRSTSRVVSAAPSRRTSPKKEQEERKESKKKEKKVDKKSSSASDSDE